MNPLNSGYSYDELTAKSILTVEQVSKTGTPADGQLKLTTKQFNAIGEPVAPIVQQVSIADLTLQLNSARARRARLVAEQQQTLAAADLEIANLAKLLAVAPTVATTSATVDNML